MNSFSLSEQLEQFPLQQVKAGGLNIAYRTAGEGAVVMLLHGISSGSGSWINQFRGLAQQFCVVAWDAPGYGGSDDLGTSEPSAMDYAEALYDFIHALDLKQPLIVGHSLGALIASAFASRYPDCMLALILADPAQGYGNADAQQQAAVYRQRPKMLDELGAKGLADARAHALLSPDANKEQVAIVADGMRRLRMKGFSCASYLLAYDDIWRYLPDYRESILVLCGEEDDITPPLSAIALSERYCQALYVSIAAAGHASYIDSPDAFNSAVARFSLVKQSDEMNLAWGEK